MMPVGHAIDFDQSLPIINERLLTKVEEQNSKVMTTEFSDAHSQRSHKMPVEGSVETEADHLMV